MRLKQIYMNVLVNAIKYTPEGGKIVCRAYQEPVSESGKVRLVVVISDNGIGMSEEFMEEMFKKFKRATDTRINSVSGYGLGLTIVKQLVELMAGTILVESKPGEGTTFNILLDLPYVESRTVTFERSLDDSSACAGMHVLVAEDNEMNREVITTLLEMYGITCECVEDGKLCLEQPSKTLENPYDAILMDMQECLDAGMNAHLSKPVNMEKLLSLLKNIKEE